MIAFKNLHKSFGKLTVLDGLDLTIKKGGIVAILGPNGSGKTTLIKCLLGMVIPNKGEITYNDESVLKKWDYRNNLNYLPQIANFPPNLTVIELINMVKNLRPKQSNEDELIKLFGLKNFLSKKLGNLSGGTKQKVNIVLTFMFDSDLIILDEPTTGLHFHDIDKLIIAFNALILQGHSILVIEHNTEVLKCADHIIDLGPEGGENGGHILFEGTPEQLIRKKNNETGRFLRKVFSS